MEQELHVAKLATDADGEDRIGVWDLRYCASLFTFSKAVYARESLYDFTFIN